MVKRYVGNLGEEIACKHLLERGFEIVCRNFKSIYGEIDIIARDSTNIIFVEVKTRKNNLCGTPAEAVNIKKQVKIKNTALDFINQNNLTQENFRFDVIEIILSSKYSINHIMNAFEF